MEYEEKESVLQKEIEEQSSQKTKIETELKIKGDRLVSFMMSFYLIILWMLIYYDLYVDNYTGSCLAILHCYFWWGIFVF